MSRKLSKMYAEKFGLDKNEILVALIDLSILSLFFAVRYQEMVTKSEGKVMKKYAALLSRVV